ncbi:MAG: zinc ABC transporter substrate-binding protein [Candidatus Hydrogenedentes bacterium]|nr:zinc ABC transporter substrate-binding protein [Candidatus Hydrogenedentota bacterium]
MSRTVPVVAMTFGIVLALTPGCGVQETANNGKLRITATTGMIADTARKIGGDYVEVQALMGPGVDPHLYKATQGDLIKLREAEIVLYNGLHLEGRMADVLEKMGQFSKAVAVTDTIPEDLLRQPPEFKGQHDPHVWFDLSMWQYVVDRIARALGNSDTAHQAEYEANAAAYKAQLQELHDYAKEQIGLIPKESRVLVTAHDAFGYFGRAYDIEVMGLQGISTMSEAGLQDVEQLADLVAGRKIKAVFVESSIPRRNIDALVAGVQNKGHDVQIGGTLYSDAMGEAGTAEGEFLGMFRYNVDTIVEALR